MQPHECKQTTLAPSRLAASWARCFQYLSISLLSPDMHKAECLRAHLSHPTQLFVRELVLLSQAAPSSSPAAFSFQITFIFCAAKLLFARPPPASAELLPLQLQRAIQHTTRLPPARSRHPILVFFISPSDPHVGLKQST